MPPKEGLPEGCLRIIRACCEPQGCNMPPEHGDRNVAIVLSKRDYLKRLSQSSHVFLATNKGRKAVGLPEHPEAE